MNPHFFTAPIYFAFIWFRVQRVQGGGVAHFVILSGEKGRVLKNGLSEKIGRASCRERV